MASERMRSKERRSLAAFMAAAFALVGVYGAAIAFLLITTVYVGTA
jgi:hypothetical protein